MQRVGRDLQLVAGPAQVDVPVDDRVGQSAAEARRPRPRPCRPAASGGELAGVPVSTTSPGSSVISRAEVGQLVAVVGQMMSSASPSLHDLAVQVRA